MTQYVLDVNAENGEEAKRVKRAGELELPEDDAHQHPHVLASKELLCFDFNTIDGVCTAKGGSVTYTEDTIYSRPDITELILDGTNIICKKDNGFACALTFKIKSDAQSTFRMINNSTIEAKGIFIDSPTTYLIIKDGSRLSADGRSDGYVGWVKNQGASYVGQGGYCPLDGKPHTEKHYGSFDLKPNFNNIQDMR